MPLFLNSCSNATSEFTDLRPVNDTFDNPLPIPNKSFATLDLPLPGPPAKNTHLRMPGSSTPSFNILGFNKSFNLIILVFRIFVL